MLGPNVKKLIAQKISTDAVPENGDLQDAIKFLANPGSVLAGIVAAKEWIAEAISVVRTAAEPNPWKEATDEEIAGEILRGIEEAKKKRKA